MMYTLQLKLKHHLKIKIVLSIEYNRNCDIKCKLKACGLFTFLSEELSFLNRTP